MDEHTDAPGSPKRPYFRSYWAPLCLLLTGLLITAFTAHLMGQRAREQSALLFQARHNAMVNALADYRHLAPGTQAFSSRFDSQVPDGLSVRIHTLNPHTKTAAFEASTGQQPQTERTLRSEITLAGKDWLVSSTPDSAVFQSNGRRFTALIWASGALISALGALLCGLAAFQWRRQTLATDALQASQQVLNRELSNVQTEKRILRQALNDSEQRSRDLVSLSGGLMCELDEKGKAGYVSAQAADLLGLAPADLAGTRIDSLISEPDQQAFHDALNAARQDRQTQRVDLSLVTVNQQLVPTTLRVLALHDTLHGFSGYRLTLQPRLQG